MNKIGEQLIKDLHLEALPPAERMAVVEKFGDTLFQAVLVRGMEALTEPQKDALDAALKEKPDGGQDVLMDFFMANVPDFQTIVDEEAARLHDKIVSVIG